MFCPYHDNFSEFEYFSLAISVWPGYFLEWIRSVINCEFGDGLLNRKFGLFSKQCRNYTAGIACVLVKAVLPCKFVLMRSGIAKIFHTRISPQHDWLDILATEYLCFNHWQSLALILAHLWSKKIHTTSELSSSVSRDCAPLWCS